MEVGNELLAELRQRKQWVVHNGDKVPRRAFDGTGASVTNPGDWCDYETAVTAIQGKQGYGLGFVLTENDPYTVIDLDATTDATILANQTQVFDAFLNTYAERSPSGKGCHIWTKGNAPGRKFSEQKLEVYSSARYMTVTFDPLDGCNVPVMEYQTQLDDLVTSIDAYKRRQPQVEITGELADAPETISDKQVIATAEGAKNGDKFKALWKGDMSDHNGDHSAADLALCNMLAFYSRNRSQVERLFRSSQLGQREKANRADYMKRTLDAAFASLPTLSGVEFGDAIKQNPFPIRKRLAPGTGTYPAPMSDDAFIGIAGEFVQLIEPETEADPHALLISFLQMFGAAIGAEPHYKIESAKQHANLFTVIVGKTSKGRKGTAFGYLENFFKIIDPQFVSTRFVSGMSSSQGLVYEVRDPITTGKDKDPGVADKRLFVVESEFAKPLNNMKREGNTLSETIRVAWDSKKLQTLAKSNKDVCANPHISIQGHITNEELVKQLTSVDSFNGFANRFLWVCVRRSKDLPFGGNIDEAKLFYLSLRVSELLTWQRNVGEVKMDDETRQLWDYEYRNNLNTEKEGLFGALTDRNTAQILRLALIYALLDPQTSYDRATGKTFIRIAHLRAALEVWRYCEDSVYHIFGDITVIALADSIKDKLDAAGFDGMTLSAIHKAYGNNKSAQELNRALNLLRQQGNATCETTGKTKPSYTWRATQSTPG